MMMIQRDTEVAADAVQRPRCQRQAATRSLERTQTRQLRLHKLQSLTGCMQHPAVEAGIVGQKGMAAFHEGHELRPQFREGGGVFQYGPGQAMHMGEQNTGGRRTDQAVNETYGQMLFYNNKPIEAFYYSTSCGHGTDGSVWGKEGEALPYLRSMQIKKGARELTVEDNDTFDEYIRSQNITSYDASYPMFRWHVDIKASILSSQIPEAGNVTDVNVVSRGLGGIASEVEVKGDGGSYKIKGQSQVRSMLGNTELVIKKQDGTEMTGTASLPSAFISIEKRTAEDGSIVFRVYGGGFGHGVGMSQNGAHSMAKAGRTYKDILDFFYHGAEIRTE